MSKKKAAKKAVQKRVRAPGLGATRNAGGKVALLEQAVQHHRNFCRSCGMTIPLKASKNVGLCAVCRRFCTGCGRVTSAYGHYGVCPTCVGRIHKTLAYMKEHDGRLPPTAEQFEAAAARAESCVCAACGDPATQKIGDRRYCDECFAEKQEPIEADG